MKKSSIISLLAVGILALSVFSGCNSKATETEDVQKVQEVVEEVKEEIPEETIEEKAEQEEEKAEEETTSNDNKIELEDGIYLATFKTDNSMFHVNETLDDKGILTVKNGEANIHIALTSKNIKNLYLGTCENVEDDEANWLQPVEEDITYPDGLTETVNAFDVPVPYLNEEFDLALIGKKGIWYDHKVSVSDPIPYEEKEDIAEAKETEAEDGLKVEVTLEGGSGKSTIESPAIVKEDGKGGYLLTVCWSSPHYDYMLLDGEKYLPVNTEGNSVFEIPVSSLDTEIDVIADTVAMSKPHEIEYKITLKSIK